MSWCKKKKKKKKKIKLCGPKSLRNVSSTLLKPCHEELKGKMQNAKFTFIGVWTQMCVHSMCNQPAYNGKNPDNTFFYNPHKS